MRNEYLWAAIIVLLVLDFTTTFIGITSGIGTELNPYTALLWQNRNYAQIILFMFIQTPFFLYGLWTFFKRNSKFLWINIVFYSITIINNLILINHLIF